MLEKILELCKENKIDQAIDILFYDIDTFLINDNFDAVDKYLFSMNLKEYPVDILIGFLTITLSARSKLAHRDLFLERVTFELKKRNIPSNDLEALLSGL